MTLFRLRGLIFFPAGQAQELSDDEHTVQVAPNCFYRADVTDEFDRLQAGVESSQHTEAVVHTLRVIGEPQLNLLSQAAGIGNGQQIIQAAEGYADHQVHAGGTPQLVRGKVTSREDIANGEGDDCNLYGKKESVNRQEQRLPVGYVDDVVVGKLGKDANADGNTQQGEDDDQQRFIPREVPQQVTKEVSINGAKEREYGDDELREFTGRVFKDGPGQGKTKNYNRHLDDDHVAVIFGLFLLQFGGREDTI